MPSPRFPLTATKLAALLSEVHIGYLGRTLQGQMPTLLSAPRFIHFNQDKIWYRSVTENFSELDTQQRTKDYFSASRNVTLACICNKRDIRTVADDYVLIKRAVSIMPALSTL